MDNSFYDNYAEILPVFKYGDENIAKSISSDMDRAIKKSAKVIKRHSITVKPKQKKNKGKTRKGETAKMIADIKKAKKVLGRQPKRNIKDSVESLVAWYKKRPHGWNE